MSDGELSEILTRAGVRLDDAPWRDIAEMFARPAHDRSTLVLEMTGRLSAPDDATTMIRALAAEPEASARQLALELAARTQNLNAILVPWLRPLLRDRTMPRRVLLDAAKALVGVTGQRGGTTARVLRDFAAGFGRLRVLHYRTALKKHFAGVGAFDRLCARLMIVMPLRCPKCGVRRKPRSMVRHLWHRHRRLLSGRRVRSPMAWLDDWSARATASSEPLDGLAELAQTLLRRDLHDSDTESDLRYVAAEKQCVLCPHCHALVPRFNASQPLPPLKLSDHRLSGEGVVIARAADGIRATVELTGRDGQRWTAPDPRGWWRSAPANRRMVLPWIVLAIIAAVAVPTQWAVLGVGLLLTLACLARMLVRARAAPEFAGSLIDTAWMLGSRDPDWFDSRYRARLALVSGERGRASIRARVLHESADSAEHGPIAEWAPLAALRIRDALAVGDDPVRLVADIIGGGLHDERFAVSIESVLALVPWREWPAGRRQRLRVAIAEQCFAFGLTVLELAELGRAMPEFGDALESGKLSRLGILRHFWLRRLVQPRLSDSPATTIFELALYPPIGDELLEQTPDALLYLPLPGWGPGGQTTPLIVGERGLFFRGAWLSAPAPIEVHIRRYGRGYELHFGTVRFFYDRDPSHLAETLSVWSELADRELSLAAATVPQEPDGRRLERLLSAITHPCPACGGLLRERP